MEQNMVCNRLVHEKSPYLLQHARNPVNWYPWGDEAFRKAREENKPIFLSVGYSTCHWCHVMARESFQDSDVAAVLNEGYVAVKVDREERPDVDHVYMTVCQMLTGSGGWPLTIIGTPEGKPFFAGTYFPKRDKGGVVGLLTILEAVREAWEKDEKTLTDRAQWIFNTVAPKQGAEDCRPGDPEKPSSLSRIFAQKGGIGAYDRVLELGYQHFQDTFDEKYGGFGDAPKFPSPHNIAFLLRYWKRKGEEKALQMAEKTLRAIRLGGTFDQLGFGFFRYATDRKWRIPHFEKMLYDNAGMLVVVTKMYQATGSEEYRRWAAQIITFLEREMTSPQGAFYSAIDAESEGEEGAYYVWTPEQVKKVLGEQEGGKWCELYGVTKQGNFHGKSVLHLKGGSGPDSSRRKLLSAREERVRPHTDDKVLTSWNALAIGALAMSHRAFGYDYYLSLAKNALSFVLDKMLVDGRLYARYRDRHVAFPGYLDDYAFLVWALLQMYQACFDPVYLKRAASFCDDMVQLFWDKDRFGFFMTEEKANEGPSDLIFRPKETYDGALPSGNSVAIMVLLRLAHLLEESRWEDLAIQALDSLVLSAKGAPSGHGFLLCAMDYADSAQDIRVLGTKGDPAHKGMLSYINGGFFPGVQVIYPADRGEGEGDTGEPALQLCQNKTCTPLIKSVEELKRALHRVP